MSSLFELDTICTTTTFHDRATQNDLRAGSQSLESENQVLATLGAGGYTLEIGLQDRCPGWLPKTSPHHEHQYIAQCLQLNGCKLSGKVIEFEWGV